MNSEAQYVRDLFLKVLSSPEALSCECILLSGGLDTSIASELVKTFEKSQLKAGITLTIDPSANPSGLFEDRVPQDIVYARKIAAKLQLAHHILTPTLDELFSGEMMEFCVRVLKTFDGMGLRNSIVIASSLLYAKQMGYRRVCTGDGADELFAGYNFMHGMGDKELRQYTRNMAKTMSFCAFPLAKALGIEVWSPFLDPRIQEYALSERGGGRDIKIGEFNGTIHGKLVLRQAFPEVVSAKRTKEPIECGSGTTVIGKLMGRQIADKEFASEKEEALAKYSVVVRDKEHLGYFRIFKKVILEDPEMLRQMPPRFVSEDGCPDCRFQLREGTSFCHVCGLYPARPVDKKI